MKRNHRGSTERTRRDFLRMGAGLVAGGIGITAAAAQQVSERWGTTGKDGGGTIPLRKPNCSVDFLDRREYLHNMEIHSFIKAPGSAGNDGVSCPLWVRGSQRVLLGMGIDITDPKKPVLAYKPQGGSLAYVANLKKWIALGTAGRGNTAQNVQYPRGWYDNNFELRDKYLASKAWEGLRTFDVTDPARPVQLGELANGSNAGPFWDGGKYASHECRWDNRLRNEGTDFPVSAGLSITDVSDPANIKQVARWWAPGQMKGEEEAYNKWVFAGNQSSWTGNHGGMIMPRRPEEGGTIGYAGFGAFGMYIFDLTDMTKPQVLSRLSHPMEPLGAIPWHTCFPVEAGPSHPRLQNLIIGTFEPLESDCQEPQRVVHIVDVKDKRHPRIIGWLPTPMPDPTAPYSDFCCARGRVGSHIIQAWAAPGVNQPHLVALTYYNAGLRIFDISDPSEPKEVAYFVPSRRGDLDKYSTWKRQDCSVFVEWDRNLIWVSTNYSGDDEGGLYCMSSPALGKPILEPRKVTQWTVPHINRGWDAQTPTSVYFGRGLDRMG